MLGITLTPTKQLGRDEVASNAKLNLLARPTAALTGTLDTSQITDKAVTPAKADAGAWFWCTDSGTANSHTVSTGKSLAALTNGLIIAYKVNAGPNTGANGTPDVNVDSLGAKLIYHPGGTIVRAGTFRAGQVVELRYYSTGDYFVLLSQDGNSLSRYAVSTGSANTYVLTHGGTGTYRYPTLAAVVGGLEISFKASFDNTGAVQINVDGLGAVDLVKGAGTALDAGDILTDQIVKCVYDAAVPCWKMTSPIAGAVVLPPAAIIGATRNLVVNNTPGLTNTSLTITADEAIVKTTGNVPKFLASVNVTAAITTSGAGGLDTGAEANSTWYFFWLIYNPSTATTSTLLSTSSTAPTMPSGYTYKALLGAVYNNSGGNFDTLHQQDRTVFLNDTNVFTATAGVTSYTSQALTAIVPSIAKTVSGTMGASTTAGSGTTDWGISIAGDSNGLGARIFAGTPSTTTGLDSFVWGAPYDNIPLKTAQNVFWKTPATTALYRLNVSRYTI